MRNYWLLLLIPVVISSATSCTYNNPLIVTSATPSVVVFYGTVQDADGEDVSGPGFLYGPVTLRWNGDKNFHITSLGISIPANGKLSGDYVCSFDSTNLSEAFGITGDVLEPNINYKSDGQFVCTGIGAKAPKGAFTVAGTTKISGFTGGATDQKFFKADTKMFFYYFPKGD